jgi:PKD repeat protein
MDVGPVSISPGPDVFVKWVNPSDRIVHKGEKVNVPVRLTNRGSHTYASLLSIAWGEDEVVSRSVSIPGGSSLTFRLEWDTTSATVGTRVLSAIIGLLPYERSPSDNLLSNGTVQVNPPNRSPDLDPGGPYSGQPGEALSFDGTLSFDIDGQIVSYRWDFGDGSWSYGDLVTHAYDNEGDYWVTLTAVDDDGGSSSIETMVQIVSSRRKTLRVLVHDSITGNPVAGVRLVIGSGVYFTGEEHVPIEVEMGQRHVGISKPGYVDMEKDIQVQEDMDLNYQIEPVIQLFGSDAGGNPKMDFTEMDSIYVSIWAPGVYPALLYVLPDGGAREGKVLLDSSPNGHEGIATGNGTIIEMVWGNHAIRGSYDVVLDLNSNGLYESSTDRLFNDIGPAFRIPEVCLQLILLSGLIAGLVWARK